jgi:hypothetical protein
MSTEALLADRPHGDDDGDAGTTAGHPARGWRFDAVAIAALLLAFPVVHDVRGMLTAPYFLDEAWVALSVRFPVSELPTLTASTPIGWTFLLRLIPGWDSLRLLPLLFHLVGLVAAYALGRQLGWRSVGISRLGGLACAVAVLLLPVQQVRHDLKQYTADAAVTLILLALAARTEARASTDPAAWRRGLIVLAGVVAVSSVISSVTVIAASCAFGGLILVAAARRQWRRVAETAVAGVAGGLVYLVVYLLTTARGSNPALKDFWAAYFPTVSALPTYLKNQSLTLYPLLGADSPAKAALFSLFCVAGVVTVFRLGRPATAVAIVLLPVAAVVLGVGRIYPLLDLRTSHYLLVAIGAVAGLGVAGTAVWLSTVVRRIGRPVLVATAVVVVVLAGFAANNQRWYRFDGIKPGVDYRTAITLEDSRAAVEYIAAHRAPGDVIVVSALGRYGFGFYWRADPMIVVPYNDAVGFIVAYPGQPSIVPANSGTVGDIRAALKTATDLAAQHGPATRIWLFRSHVDSVEAQAWQQALTGFQVQDVTHTVEPVSLVSRAA